MSEVLVVQGGRVICPRTGTDRLADVLLEDGRVRQLRDPGHGVSERARVVDATGAWVMPGAIDLETHLRDPGAEVDEPLDETLAAAAQGGVTTVVGLPTTTPCADGGDAIEHRRAMAARIGGVDLRVAGALTAGRRGQDLADIGEMSAAGATVFSDLPRRLDDAVLLRAALEYVGGFGHLAQFRPCLAGLGTGDVAEGTVSTTLGLAPIPEAAEVAQCATLVELSRLTGARVHLAGLSSARAVKRLRAARAEGLAVSGHVHPYHLIFDETVHARRPYDTALKLDPPLRTARDREALHTAVKDGTLLVASGHRALGPAQKEVEFARAAAGAIALPLMLSLLLDDEVGAGLSASEAASALADGPARTLGLDDRGHLGEGARGDLVVFDPSCDTSVEALLAHRHAQSTPLHPKTPLRGAVVATIARGRVVFDCAGH